MIKDKNIYKVGAKTSCKECYNSIYREYNPSYPVSMGHVFRGPITPFVTIGSGPTLYSGFVGCDEISRLSDPNEGSPTFEHPKIPIGIIDSVVDSPSSGSFGSSG